ncbi:MAG: hypothetical protein WC058_11025 [Phycisphaeraceae bacterium]
MTGTISNRFAVTGMSLLLVLIAGCARTDMPYDIASRMMIPDCPCKVHDYQFTDYRPRNQLGDEHGMPIYQITPEPITPFNSGEPMIRCGNCGYQFNLIDDTWSYESHDKLNAYAHPLLIAIQQDTGMRIESYRHSIEHRGVDDRETSWNIEGELPNDKQAAIHQVLLKHLGPDSFKGVEGDARKYQAGDVIVFVMTSANDANRIQIDVLQYHKVRYMRVVKDPWGEEPPPPWEKQPRTEK